MFPTPPRLHGGGTNAHHIDNKRSKKEHAAGLCIPESGSEHFHLLRPHCHVLSFLRTLWTAGGFRRYRV